MSDFVLELQNPAWADYPYVQSNRKNLTASAHFHDEVELIEVVSGEIEVICNGQKLLFRAGEIGVLMPGEIHSYRSERDNVTHVLKLFGRHSVEKNELAHLRFPKPLDAESSLAQTVRDAFAEIRREHDESAVGYGHAVNSLCASILCALIRSDEAAKNAFADDKKQVQATALLQKVNDHLEAHGSEPMTLSDAASACGFSPYYFAHLFKKVTGNTFYRHLTEYRCGRAAALLDGGNGSMIEVAYACGFSDNCCGLFLHES